MWRVHVHQRRLHAPRLSDVHDGAPQVLLCHAWCRCVSDRQDNDRQLSRAGASRCGACTYTNDDCTHRDCPMCTTERPKRYFVVPGASVSATARTTTVDRCKQARLAALRDAVQDAPPPVDEEPIAEGVPVVPVQGAVAAVPSRLIMLERLVGTLVDVVGTTTNNRSRSCPHHS